MDVQLGNFIEKKTRAQVFSCDGLLLIKVVSIVLKGILPNETENYDTEIKPYQFEPYLQLIKKVSPGKRTGLTRVFKEKVGNIVRCDCQRYII